MKPLSPQAAALVQQLLDLTGARSTLAARRAEVLASLTGLRDLREPAVAPHVLSLVFGDDSVVARAAAEVLHGALSATTPGDLPTLDEVCRRSGPWTSAWASLTPVGVSRFAALGTMEVSVVGVASFHASGYVREAAVTRLDTLHGGDELPYLLIRMNDWVAPVARRALRAVERRTAPEYASALVRSLPLLLRLGGSTRWEHRDFLDGVFALLRDPAQSSALAEGFESGDALTRRASFGLAREGAGAALAGVLRHALTSADPMARFDAAVDARRLLGERELREILPILLADPFMPVRREGLEAVVERVANESAARLRAALFDRHRTIRELARFHLRRASELTDLTGPYRDRLRSGVGPREVAVALLGLGETGDRADVPSVRPYLGHEAAAVRAAAVRALGLLDLAGYADEIVGALNDEAPRVSHAAREALRFRPSIAGADRLWEVVRTAPREHGRLDALALAAGISKWDSLPILIEATADPAERVRAVAGVRLRGWLARQNRSFVQPSGRQIEAVRAALDSQRYALKRFVADEIEQALRAWTE